MNRKNPPLAHACIIFLIFSGAVFSQGIPLQKSGFISSAERRVAGRYRTQETVDGKRISRAATLEDICPAGSSKTARRILSDYGAIFVAGEEVNIPPRCIFRDEDEVRKFQNDLKSQAMTKTIDGVSITLQKPALEALLNAREKAAGMGLRISPRGGSSAAKRSYEDTRTFWNTRFLPGLNYWVRRGKLKQSEADAAKWLPTDDQVERVLDWEDRGLFFSTTFTKSILYSVAAPGASQHISMLAIDIQQFTDQRVRAIMAEHGWFQTVKSDLPHFTYLGLKESDLPAAGLTKVRESGQDFWIPDFK